MWSAYHLCLHDELPFELQLAHLYFDATHDNRSIWFRATALRGQQPVICSKREDDEHSPQCPKEPSKKQRHTKLHGPGSRSHWLHRLRLIFLLQLQRVHVTEADTVAPPALLSIHTVRRLVILSSRSMLGYWILTPSVCVCYRRISYAHDSCGPYWALQPTLHPSELFWGRLKVPAPPPHTPLRSTVGPSVLGSWRVWRGGSTQK